MDLVRQRLVEKIDSFLTQVVSSGEVPAQSHLQIIASLVLPQAATPDNRPVLLESLDIDGLRHLLTNDGMTLGSVSSHGDPVTALVSTSASSISGTTASSLLTATSDLTVRDNQAIASQSSHRFSPEAPPDRHKVEYVEPESVSSETSPPTEGGTYQRVENSEPNPWKRRKVEKAATRDGPTAVDKLIEGIWEQIHNPKIIAMDEELVEKMDVMAQKLSLPDGDLAATHSVFDNVTKCCRQVTTGGRVERVLEVMIQAYWVDCYDTRLAALKAERPELRAHQHKRMVLTEACASFGWSEKELRNRMAIWKGYRDIKNTTGWSALVFAGPGIYRFCKYRLGFDNDSICKLQNLRIRVEVAADTLQPQWRRLLSLVGGATDLHWHGHPHDWTVSLTSGQEPLPLAETYKQWDTDFSFVNIEESTIDVEQWQDVDPRRFDDGPEYFCKSCSLRQSQLKEENECECFPDLYSPNARSPCPVQIFRTENGKNNGLVACCSLDRGRAIGEFVGLVTKGLADVDVMQSQAGDHEPYQIWQGRRGNFTRFINHSCAPNCQFETFSWMGVQRIIVVSKGIAAGREVTVDYSPRYWDNLSKICLCGESCCRYRDRVRKTPDREQR